MDRRDPSNSPYRGPPRIKLDRNARRERDTRRDAEMRPPPLQRRDASTELRVFGFNACIALFARRPQDLRKVWLIESRIPALKSVLAWCVAQRLGYRVVGDEDLAKLTGTQHHEGVCFDTLRPAELSLAMLLARLPAGPALIARLDGVGNPHNFGAVLRSAANFGVGGVVLAADSPLGLSGAACRIAEGGAEAVPIARLAPGEDASPVLRAAGFAIAATVPRDGESPYARSLPPRLAVVFGAEGEGLDAAAVRAADRCLTIPGTGAVESLNIAASAAVLFGEWYRTTR